MKRTIKLAVVAALALGATSAFATNGANLIGVGAKARGMGGTGIAVAHGAESGVANPALITKIKSDNEISFGGTLFMPTIKVSNDMTNAGGANGPEAKSKADIFAIPAVSLASKINDNWYWGIGMWGTGGLGVDYRDQAATNLGGTTFQMVTALQTLQFGVPIAYTNKGFSLGITPVLQYSAMDINYVGADPLTGASVQNGAGVAQDLAFGFNLGAAYEVSNFTIGAMYKAKIKYDVDDVLNNALNGFGVGAAVNPLGANITEMATPEEYGVGVSYTMQGHTLAVDYRYINWEDAEGFKDFGWESQDVLAIGYEYATDAWALRAGYQYAKGAVQDNTGKNLQLDQAAQAAGMAEVTNTFNLLGFPGTQETNITFGGTYVFNETLSLDLAAVYGLDNTESFVNFTGNQVRSKHSEEAYSVQVNYAF